MKKLQLILLLSCAAISLELLGGQQKRHRPHNIALPAGRKVEYTAKEVTFLVHSIQGGANDIPVFADLFGPSIFKEVDPVSKQPLKDIALQAGNRQAYKALERQEFSGGPVLRSMEK